MRERFSDVPHTADLLTNRVMLDFYEWLLTTGRHGRNRASETRRKIIQDVQAALDWANEDEEYGPHVPRLRRVSVETQPIRRAIAPNWSQADACIAASTGWRYRAIVLMRFTGLRPNLQVMQLRWEDFDLRRLLVVIRPELGKTRQEKAGRVIPISKHLASVLKTWDPGSGFVVDSPRAKGPRERMLRERDTNRAWARAKLDGEPVDSKVWEGQPHKAFRKCFVSELTRAGADREAVELLVGHDLGSVRKRYLDDEFLAVREAVDLIPPLNRQLSTPSLADA